MKMTMTKLHRHTPGVDVSFFPLLLTILQAVSLVNAIQVEVNQNPDEVQQCSGMYSKKAWGGPESPDIITMFRPYVPVGEDDPNDNPVVAFIIYEWSDRQYLGVPAKEEGRRQYICDEPAVNEGYCEADVVGNFIVAKNASSSSFAEIRTASIHTKDGDRDAINYPILKTGYYCVSTAPMGDFDYTGLVEFRNAYGELPGAQIAKLPFYGGLTIAYAVIGAFWAFLYVQNRHDVLPVQNYITATIVFLVIEMLATWGYYDYMNRNGANGMSNTLMIFVSILNAFRNTFSFYLLLVVCMGFGVVTNNLGKRMTYARGLALTHFVFGVIYAIASLTLAPEDAGPLVLFVVLPLAATLTAFYVWTLNSLGATLKDLTERKQRVKAQMYKRLWWCIFSSVLVIFGFFALNSVAFAGQDDPDFTPKHWQTRWFILDGWLNLVYLADVMFIAYLWRPTANNRRFAMSDEISQDDEGFEIASIRDSLDDEEARPEAGAMAAGLQPPPGSVSRSESLLQKPAATTARNRSPLPAPKPQRPSSTANIQAPRDSLDGDTIFAVGEDELRFSDEDEDDELSAVATSEKKGLTSSAGGTKRD